MKCSKCGSEVNDNAIFCEECGTEIPRPKDCPRCHSRVKPSAKFCLKCGYQFPANATGTAQHAASGAFFRDKNLVAGDVKQTSTQNGIGRGSAGASLGDKNMIAGDVNQVAIGRQENIHLGDGATYVKHEDETKTVVKCHICGRINTIANFFECPKCHEMTCEKDYNRDLKLCANCKEKEYQAAFRDARENGGRILSPEQRKKLEKYKIAADKAEELHREVIRSETWRPAADDESNVDYFLFVQGSINDAYTLLRGMEEDEREKYNSMFLSRLLYISLKNVSRGKDNELLTELKKMQDSTSAQAKQSPRQEVSADSAVETANRIVELVFQPGNDILDVYLVLIDQILEKQPFPERVRSTLRRAFDVKADTGMSAFARKLLEKAEDFWPDSVLLKCRRILYALMQFEETGRSKYKEDAEKDMESLPVLTDSASVMERSWIAKVRREMHAETFDPTPRYCEENGGLYFFVLNPRSSESFCKMADSLDTTVKPLRDEYFKMVMTAATEFPSPSSGVLKKLGDCYTDGIGTQKNVPAALLCYQKAAAADGIKIAFNGTVLKSYRDNDDCKEFAVLLGITEIADGAFAGCKLTKVIIPSTVRTICTGAFRNCKALLSVELSEGLNHIQRKAFEGCDSLKSITIPMSVSRLEEEFSPSCAVLFVGDKPINGAPFLFDGLFFSIPAATGIRAIVHSFSKKVQNVEDKVTWCHTSLVSNCNRDCTSCLFSSEHGAPTQKILAFLTFCRNNGIQTPEPPGYVDGLFTLAEDHMLGKGGLKQDTGKAVAWYREIVERGYAGYGDCLKRIRAVFEKSGFKGYKEAVARVLENLFSDSRNCSVLATEDWLFLLRLLPGSFLGIRFCPWDSLSSENWVDLLSTNPEYAEHCGLTADSAKTCWEKFSLPQWKKLTDRQQSFQPFLDLRKGINVVSYLRKEQRWEKFCNWSEASKLEWLNLLKDRELLQRLVVLKPELLNLCPWDDFTGDEWGDLFNVEPDYIRFCEEDVLRRLSKSAWFDMLKDKGLLQRLLMLKPELLKLCPWDGLTGKDWIALFSIDPEYVRFCGKDVFHDSFSVSTWISLLKNDDLLQRLLALRPELMKLCPWDRFKGKDWVELLLCQPEYVRRCKWNALDDADFARLKEKASDLRSHIGDIEKLPLRVIVGMGWEKHLDWSRVTTGKQWCEILPKYPSLGKFCQGWDHFTTSDWVNLLTKQPKFQNKCNSWTEFDPEEWDKLLKAQPKLKLEKHFPFHDLRRILNYTNYHHPAIFVPLAKKYAFMAASAFLLVFTFFSLWGPTGWFRLFGGAPIHAMISGAVWIAAAVFCAWCYRSWGPFFRRVPWLNLAYAGIISFPLYMFYHWSFLFSRWSFALIICGLLSSLSFVVPALLDDEDSCHFFACFSPYFITFSWFLLRPVHWSVWQIVIVCLFFLILFFMGAVLWEDGYWDENPFTSFILSMIFPLIISVWFLLSPVSSQACYKIANELQTSFPSASQAFYRKGQSAVLYRNAIDRDYAKSQYALGKYDKAVEAWSRAAEWGDAESQFRLGDCYHEGSGVKRYEPEAVNWYRKAAEQDHVEAQATLGKYLFEGKYTTKDETEAVKWWRKAAEQGHVAAQFNLGKCYEEGIGVKQDYAEAFKWYSKAAEQGHAEAKAKSDSLRGEIRLLDAAERGDVGAMTELAVCFEEGKRFPKDLTESLNWYRKAAEQGHAEAQFRLAQKYSNGLGVSKNETEAVKWYQKAAEQGNAEAQLELGKCYYFGEGVGTDYKEAVRWYRKAAEQGNGSAQLKLARCYESGVGVNKDYSEAVGWYLKAAERGQSIDMAKINSMQEIVDLFKKVDLGDAEAQLELAKRYEKGIGGMNKDDAESAKWYRKAAEQGNAEAQSRVGKMYYNGEGVKANLREAVNWYRKAAEQGMSEAQYLLGKCYCDGAGVRKDEAEALSWYLKAAEQRHTNALEAIHNLANTSNPEILMVLGTLYNKGTVVPVDQDKAVQCFLLAAEQGRTDGIDALVAQAKAGNQMACQAIRQLADGGNRKAWNYIASLAEQDRADAQFYLGECYYNGVVVSKNVAEAVKWYRKAAEQGYAEAQYDLGICYEEGYGVAKDMFEAFKWYRKAAEQGHAKGQFELGESYYHGRGVSVNDHEAVKWYRMAAEQNHAEALFKLGILLYNGLGSYHDKTEGFDLISKAAAQGQQDAIQFLNSLSQTSSGSSSKTSGTPDGASSAASKNQEDAEAMYQKGRDYAWHENDKEAMVWFRKAAELGHAGAQREVGDDYYWKREYTNASGWYLKSAIQGNKNQSSVPISQLYTMANNGNQAALDALIKLDQEGFSVARAYLKKIASTPDDYLSPKFREALRKYK